MWEARTDTCITIFDCGRLYGGKEEEMDTVSKIWLVTE